MWDFFVHTFEILKLRKKNKDRRNCLEKALLINSESPKKSMITTFFSILKAFGLSLV